MRSTQKGTGLGVSGRTLTENQQRPWPLFSPQAFSNAGLEPNVVISAIDGDVIKTCVEQGLGYAVLSEVTFDVGRDTNLRALAAGHLFPPSVTRIWISRQRYIRRYTYEFIEMCAPRWTRTSVQQMVKLTRRRRLV